MKTLFRHLIVLSIFMLFLTSCATVKTASVVPDSMIKDLTPAFNAGDYNAKVDGLIVLMDASSSMGETYQEYRKFDIAKSFVARMNKTMPPISAVSGLRTFGHASALSSQNTVLLYGMAPYNRGEMDKGLSQISPYGGPTPMSDAISAVNEDFKELAGNKALIIVSDGKVLDKTPVMEAKKLQAEMGEELCIYTVLVGADDKGKALMQEIAAVSPCGYMVVAQDVNTAVPMADYVTDVFLNKIEKIAKAPAPVPKKKDQGLGYHKPEPLLKNLGNVHFNFDESSLTEKGTQILDQHIEQLANLPDVKIIIQGHTSAQGAEAYNQVLSEKRALSVKNYLIQKGNISPERLSTVGFGETQPFVVESNPQKIHSADAKSNMRVVFEIIKN